MRVMPLNGDWTFILDPNRKGLEKGFQKPEYLFEDTISVPGSWRLRSCWRNYYGCAWYKRTFMLDEEDINKQIFICFGGVFRYADVYVNGNYVMRHEGFQSCFRADISDFVKEGINCVAVMADDVQDSSFDIMGGASVMETKYVPIAGLYEPVRLEIAAALHVSNAYAALDLSGEKVRLSVTVDNATEKKATILLNINIRPHNSEFTAIKKETSVTVNDTQKTFEIDFPASAFKLWSPEEPILYSIEILVQNDKEIDLYTQTTGFKHLSADGNQFMLNGKPYFLRGYGDDFVYPLTGLPDATSSDFYHHSINRALAYGFNTARHHSHFPFEAYLNAADELGLLVQPELALANIPPFWFNENNQELFLSQWKKLILDNRHHPCIMSWCGGNEEEWGVPFEQTLYETAKALDPYRLALATDGNFMANEIGPFHDYASIIYAEYTDVLPLDEFSDLYLRDNSGKPQIVHEMGNYCTLPVIGDLAKYENAVIYPKRLERFCNNIKAKNLNSLYNRCLNSSMALQRLCHKLNIETARQSPYVSGYHIWTFNDYYDTTQGIVNSLYEDKAYTAEQFAQLNAPSLLLWETDRYVFNSGEQANFKLKISKFHPEDWNKSIISIEISDGQQYEITKAVNGQGILDLIQQRVKIPMCTEAKHLKLHATLQCGNIELSNSWSLWVYPSNDIIAKKEIFINYLSRYLIEDCHFPVRHFTIPMPLNSHNLIITGFIYNGMLDAVMNGASMLLLAGPDTFKETILGNTFKLPWWMAQSFFYVNRSNNIQAANIIEEHPVLNDIPHDESWELNFFHLVDNRPAISIDILNLEVQPIIYGVNMQLERLAYLFELRLGKGKILVSTLNFDRNNQCHPEVRYVFRKMVNYCQSDLFMPEQTIERGKLESVLK